MGKIHLAIGLLLLITGCGPVIHTTPLGANYGPRPAEHEIALFSVKVPECSFREIAIVMGHARPIFVSTADVIEGMKNQARQLGGDAIIGFSRVVVARDEGGISNAGYTGTVIRFTEDGCPAQ